MTERAQLVLYHSPGCTQVVPRVYPGCTPVVPRLYAGCTPVVPRLYAGCTPVVPRLYLIVCLLRFGVFRPQSKKEVSRRLLHGPHFEGTITLHMSTLVLETRTNIMSGDASRAGHFRKEFLPHSKTKHSSKNGWRDSDVKEYLQAQHKERCEQR